MDKYLVELSFLGVNEQASHRLKTKVKDLSEVTDGPLVSHAYLFVKNLEKHLQITRRHLYRYMRCFDRKQGEGAL